MLLRVEVASGGRSCGKYSCSVCYWKIFSCEA